MYTQMDPIPKWVHLYPNGYTPIPKWVHLYPNGTPYTQMVHPYTQMGTPNYQP
jgi:hypothetical protein